MIKIWSRLSLLVLLTLIVAACQDDDLTPLMPEEQEGSSAIDTLPWPLTKNMDTENYRPGDDFFMYCNGSYWNSTSLGDKKIVGLFYSEVPEAMDQLKANVTLPAYEQLKAHQDKWLTNDEFYAFLKPFYDKINGIKSFDDAFRVAGELRMNGARAIVTFRTSPALTIKGSLSTNSPYESDGSYKAFLESDHPDDVLQYLDTHPLEEEVSAYYYWVEHEDEYEEAVEKAEAMAKQYLIPTLGLNEEYVSGLWGFENWFLSSIEDLKAFMKMTVFEDYARYANQQIFEDLLEDFSEDYKTNYGTRYDYALPSTSMLRNYLLDREVIERYVSPQLKREVETMCEEMKEAFVARIENLPWMSQTTKANAIRKIKAITFAVGYPERWLTDSTDLSQTTNFLEDLQLLYKAQDEMMINSLGMSRKDDPLNFGVMEGMGENLLANNAFYNSLENSINIHAPFIMPPMYEENMHPALKYGLLMASIGHELTHAVDTDGSKMDEDGNVADWWTIQDRMEFETLQQQLVELYNRFMPIPGYPSCRINGEITLSENIADLGGLEIAHDAFVAYCAKQGFKGEDLDEMERKFFQGYTEFFRSKYGYEFYEKNKDNTHCFDKERVNGVVMNIDRWYELYDVQWGDYLYLKPENRTHIW